MFVGFAGSSVITRAFYAFRAHATSVSQGRSSPLRLSRSARAKAALLFRSPARSTSAARVACAYSRPLVRAGHEKEPLERVVARNERFAVVDKRPVAEPFVEDDPRGAPSQ
jgi:hypothetical protein